MNEGSFFLFSLKCTCVIIYALVMHSRSKTRSFISMGIKVTQKHCDNDDWSIPVKISTQKQKTKQGTYHDFSQEFLRSLRVLSWIHFLCAFSANLSLCLSYNNQAATPLLYRFVSPSKLAFCKISALEEQLSSPLFPFHFHTVSLYFPAWECPSCTASPTPPLSCPAVPRTPHLPLLFLLSPNKRTTVPLSPLKLSISPSGNLNECTMKNRYPTQPPATRNLWCFIVSFYSKGR